MKHIWVVELLENGVWKPTSGVSLDKAFGIVVLRKWKSKLPHDKFRLTKYIRN